MRSIQQPSKVESDDLRWHQEEFVRRYGKDNPPSHLTKVTFRPGSNSRLLIVAPHGGRIEPWTPSLARSIANKLGCDYYCFRSRHAGKPVLNNGEHHHHITSCEILAPNLLSLVGRSLLPVSIHGTDKYARIQVGGRHGNLASLIKHLDSAGFQAEQATGDLAAMCESNFVNRSNSGLGGIQLEIPLVRYRENTGDVRRARRALASCIAEFVRSEMERMTKAQP